MDEAGPSSQPPPPPPDTMNLTPPLEPASTVSAPPEAALPPPSETQPTQATLRRGIKRKHTPVDSRLPKRVCVPRNPHRRWEVVFEPYTHWDFSTGMQDDDWAALTSLDVFYHFRWPEPRHELILDFIEGFEYAPPAKGTRRSSADSRDTIRSMVRGKPVEITAFVIREALGFDSGADLLDQRRTDGFHPKFAKYGLTKEKHIHDGNRTSALTPAYQTRAQALGDAIGFKQRLLFVSNNLLEHIFAAEEAGERNERFYWSHYVLANLRRHLIYIHSEALGKRQLRGAPVMDAVLSYWFPDREEVVGPTHVSSSFDTLDGSHEGSPATDPPPQSLAGSRICDRASGDRFPGPISASVPATETQPTANSQEGSSDVGRRRRRLVKIGKRVRQPNFTDDATPVTRLPPVTASPSCRYPLRSRPQLPNHPIPSTD